MFTLNGKKIEWRYYCNLRPELSYFTERYLVAEAALLSIFDKTFPFLFEGADMTKGEVSSLHNENRPSFVIPI